MNTIAIFFLALAANIVAQIAYKYAMTQPGAHHINISLGFLSQYASWYVVAGIMMQVIGLGAWLLLLKHHDLILVCLVATLIPVGLMLAGYFIFGESLSSLGIIGASLIMVGLSLVVVQ